MTFSGNPIFKDLLVNPQLENAFRKVKINLLAEHSVITKLLQYDQNCFADITTGHPVLDAGKFVWREDICSSAGLLLRVNQEIVGMLFLNYRRPHDFSIEEQQEIELFAHYAAIGIKAANEYQFLRETNGLVGGHTTLAWLTILRQAFSHQVYRLSNNVTLASTAIQDVLAAENVQLPPEIKLAVKASTHQSRTVSRNNKTGEHQSSVAFTY